MASLPPKKGPRMTRVCSPTTGNQEEAERVDFEAQMDSFARKVHGAIDEARNKMTDKEVEQADRKAAAILKNASSAGSRQRKGA